MQTKPKDLSAGSASSYKAWHQLLQTCCWGGGLANAKQEANHIQEAANSQLKALYA
jgi:hypothetical protein